MENMYPGRVKIEFTKCCKKEGRGNGEVCISIYTEDGNGATNHHISKESFLFFVATQYRKEIKKYLIASKI